MLLNDHMIDWLNNAYAMEQEVIKVLESQLDDFEEFPELKEKVQAHLEESKGHAETVESCIEQLGGDTSALKSGMAQAMAMGMGMMKEMMGDKVIKNSILNYATEHKEIATYTFLSEAAAALGDADLTKKMEAIVKEEQAMAEWLFTNMSEVNQKVIGKTDQD